MPYVDIKLIEGGVTFVVVDEVKSGDWGIGGQAMTAEAVHAIAAGATA